MSELVGPGSKYTDEQRLDAAIMYAHKGTLSATSKEVGIPRQTLSGWQKCDWWESTLSEVRHKKHDLYVAKYGELIEEGTRVALEKLPEASARDAMIIAATANDKLRLALNQPTSISGKSDGIEDLAAQFRALSKQWEEKQINVVSEQTPSTDDVSD